MEFFLSSVFILIFGAVVSFLLIPKFSPTVVLVIAAALLGFAVYHHMALFKNEYKLSTWQTGLIAYAPFIVLGAMILFILGYIFTKYRGGEVPVPNAPNMPSATEAANSIVETVNNAKNNIINNTKIVANNVINNANKLVNKVANNTTGNKSLTGNKPSNKGNGVTKSFFNVV
jgi:predicted PurR-regulated permease PerM